MTIFEWIFLISISIIIFFVGFAGVTGRFIFDRDKDENPQDDNEL